MNKYKLFLVAFILASGFFSGSCTQKKDLGNTLRVAIREKYKSIDPIDAQDYYTAVVCSRAYEPLYQYHYTKRPFEIVPLLAESLPLISKDQLTYVLRLKKDVRFHDDAVFVDGKGREVKAADLIYMFLRNADPAAQSDGWWLLDGHIMGLNEWRAMAQKTGKADYGASVEGLRKIDDWAIEVKLTRPYPLFLHALATPYTSLVAPEAVQKYGAEFLEHPVGTGPFHLVNISSNQLIWERHSHYHDKQQNSNIDRIVDDIVLEDQPAWLNFMQNNHDYLMRIPKDQTQVTFGKDKKFSKEMQDKGVQLLHAPGVWTTFVGINQEDPVVGGSARKKLRQAMAMAFDEVPYIEKFYLGLATAAQSIVPPGVMGFDSNYRNSHRQYNLSRAREVLKEMGYEGGKGLPELQLDTKSDTAYFQMAEYFAQQMNRLGIKVRIQRNSWPELLARIKRKQVQLYLNSWLFDFPEAENGLQLFYSGNISPGPNGTNYKDSQYDRWFEMLKITTDAAERVSLIHKMRNLLAEDLPILPLVHPSEARLVHSWVKNFVLNPFQLNVEKFLRIDVDERKRLMSQ